MSPIASKPERIWIRLDRPIIPAGRHLWKYLAGLQDRLRAGAFGTQDPQRPGFFEVEIDGNWYYLHFPKRIEGIYLIAAVGVRRHSAQTSLAVMCA